MIRSYRSFRTAVVAGGLMALATAPAPVRAQGFFVHDGDKPVVFLGNSITEQRMYTTYLETYVLTRFPKWNVTFRNVGWSGDTAGFRSRGGYDVGLKRDVLALNPACITIDFGMNDARAGQNGLEPFTTNTTRMVQELKLTVPRIALLTPSPEERFEPDQPAGSAYNKTLATYSQSLKQIAQAQGITFVDQLNPFIKVIEDGRKAGVLGPTGNPRLIPDGVHPNWAGHLVMAWAILKALNAPPDVSRLELDADTRHLVANTGCQAEIMPNENGALLTFRRTDGALPWFAPAEAAVVLKVPGFTPLLDLSRYELKVNRLAPGQYDLWVDDKKTGTLSGDELGQGVNLSLMAGAITAQSESIFKLVQQKNDIYRNRWRNIQLYTAPAWLQGPEIEAKRKAELDKLDGQIAALEEQINHLRQPVPHIFKLVATPPVVVPAPQPAAK